MASARAEFAVPQKTLNLPSPKDFPQVVTRHPKAWPYFSLERVSTTKTESSGNARAARRACAGFWNTPNTADPLPASAASAAPRLSNPARISPRRGWRSKTGFSKSFESAPDRLQHRAQNPQMLGGLGRFVNSCETH